MSRPTPETDAFAASEFVDRIDELTQLYDLAEKLERERDEARHKYNNLATEHMLVVNKLCGERDEAVEEVRVLKGILDVLKKEAQ
jgi:hypothetical protein